MQQDELMQSDNQLQSLRKSAYIAVILASLTVIVTSVVGEIREQTGPLYIPRDGYVLKMNGDERCLLLEVSDKSAAFRIEEGTGILRCK